MPNITLLAHNIRSVHNIGSIFRTAEGLGVAKIIFSGYSPYPALPTKDTRLPHISAKLTQQIHKTALGAENIVPFSYSPDIKETIQSLKSQNYQIIGLEQSSSAIHLPSLKKSQTTDNIALLIGEEVHGIPKDLVKECQLLLEIPMFGQKESFNVSVATGIALYKLTCDLN